MGYVIVGILCFIAGIILSRFIYNERKRVVIATHLEALQDIKENTNIEMEKIKEKLGKEIKEGERDEIISDIDDYFDKYYPDGYSG